MKNATKPAKIPPTNQDNMMGIPNPPRNPDAAGLNASILSMAGDPIKLNKTIKVNIERGIVTFLILIERVDLYIIVIMVPPTVKITKERKIPDPPSAMVSGTGGYEIITAANPPKAANPITPALNIPAYPS